MQTFQEGKRSRQERVPGRRMLNRQAFLTDKRSRQTRVIVYSIDFLPISVELEILKNLKDFEKMLFRSNVDDIQDARLEAVMAVPRQTS
jgi:hypothetical protein